METKVCTKCGEEKPATSEFFGRRGAHLRLRAQCKVCRNAYKKRHYEKNREKYNALSKRWREENPEYVVEYRKRYREENPEKLFERNKRYREQNPEKIAKNKKRHYEENKEQYIARNKRNIRSQPAAIYQIKNKETGKTYIGATTAFPSRRSNHKSALRTGKHGSQALQEDCNKYGLDVFEFEIIEEHPCDTDFKILEKIEEETIKRLLSEGKELYNKKSTKL